MSDTDGPGCAPQGALPALPCLYDNNSDRRTAQAAPLKPVAAKLQAVRKTAFALAANVEHFVSTFGIERCGFFTITFGRDVQDPKEAQRRFNNFARRVLGVEFEDRIRVLEPHSDGRPHYHLVVACKGDIRTGFNWEHYEAVRKWSRSGRVGPKPRGNLGRTVVLAELHERLNNAGPKYGIGRMELVPIRTNEEAVGRYVGGYISKGASNWDERYKGARWVNYSRGFERRVKGGFAWAEQGRQWRERVAVFAAKHGCADMDALKLMFGSRWAYKHRDEIREAGTIPELLAAYVSEKGLIPEDKVRSLFGTTWALYYREAYMKRERVAAERAERAERQVASDTGAQGVDVPPEPTPSRAKAVRSFKLCTDVGAFEYRSLRDRRVTQIALTLRE